MMMEYDNLPIDGNGIERNGDLEETQLKPSGRLKCEKSVTNGQFVDISQISDLKLFG